MLELYCIYYCYVHHLKSSWNVCRWKGGLICSFLLKDTNFGGVSTKFVHKKGWCNSSTPAPTWTVQCLPITAYYTSKHLAELIVHHCPRLLEIQLCYLAEFCAFHKILWVRQTDRLALKSFIINFRELQFCLYAENLFSNTNSLVEI